jgi:hypothetical protein
MSQSIILELQQDSLEPTQSVSTLLRKALLVATKLDLKDAINWIEKELSGWSPEEFDSAPKWRSVKGEVVVKKPYQGWVPVMFANPDDAKVLSERIINLPATELEALVAHDKGKGSLLMRFHPEAEIRLQKAIGADLPIQIKLTVASAKRILEEIRNNILRWSLELEKAGIKGENLTFTQAERQHAHGVQIHFHSNAQIGHIGDNSGTENIIIGNMPISSTAISDAVAEIRKHINQLNLDNGQKHSMGATLNELENESKSSNPNKEKTVSLMKSISNFLGKSTQSIIEAGTKAYVEAWIKTHAGMW